jgi:hypothetical protein
MLTRYAHFIVALLSWEVGDGFLTCSGNFSQEVLPSLGFGEFTFYDVGWIRA